MASLPLEPDLPEGQSLTTKMFVNETQRQAMSIKHSRKLLLQTGAAGGLPSRQGLRGRDSERESVGGGESTQMGEGKYQHPQSQAQT